MNKIKSFIAKLLAKFMARRIKAWAKRPIEAQEKVFIELMTGARNTIFGRDHNFSEIDNYEDFKNLVPVRDYEDFRPYIKLIKEGEPDVLWNGKPIYFAKTSGTTSGTKYIPITKDSISNHINSARNALFMYIAETGNASVINGKWIFLSGSPELETIAEIPTGRLSGIVNHHVPSYLRKNQLPSWNTNCILDWEEKVGLIVEETVHEDMRVVSGIPPWMQMYFDRLKGKTGNRVGELFPNLSLLIYGGVNFEPYRSKIDQSIGRRIDSIEFYPASEGFIAFQDSQKEKGMLLILNSGIFYEFIPADEYFKENRKRISLKDVELGINYVIILNTNAGLFGYSIGDTVKFVSKDPYRIIVTGRIKHFISAFGEHVISEEVDRAFLAASMGSNVRIIEFTVAPKIDSCEGLPYHEWFIEFDNPPKDMESFRKKINDKMCEQNSYYRDLIEGGILQPLKITVMQRDAFKNYMQSQGKLGGQNKLPRLSNDRKIADELERWIYA